MPQQHVPQQHVPRAPVPKEEAGDVSKVAWEDWSSQLSNINILHLLLSGRAGVTALSLPLHGHNTAFISRHRGLGALLLATLSGSFLGLPLALPSSKIRGKELSLLAVHTALIPHHRAGNPGFPGTGAAATLLRVRGHRQPCPGAAAGLRSATGSARPPRHPPRGMAKPRHPGLGERPTATQPGDSQWAFY